ncbi:uncharacterized protein RCC_03880 [Ramularia collo-cygni]|uniref:Aminoglycoside phosphotransferase domain-containing protein n=1 Tax=Ramularia collo-cygni TaxID=112498 RepID=A0A2D3UP03_9PEZI|nr:uncharacterized protein RCC_03880 [Ramularia collo-cygni]CZT18042.1 uncharacterized protein RCC_03880 [Ramularia collo-cygni]
MSATQKSPTSTLQPIKDTRVRRWLTLLALQTTGRLYKRSGTCIPISRHKIVKIQRQEDGESSHLAEATTMQFVSAKTSLPVPKVYCTFERKGRGYIVMERIRGQMLSVVLPSLSEASKDSLFSQLRTAMDELRALEPPSMAMQSCVGASLLDFRIAHTRGKRFGPFDSIPEFHRWLRRWCQPPLANIHWSDEEKLAIEKMIKRQDRASWPPPVFTHADLHSCNIIVQNEKLVGIIDWEFSGWYPSYWEYTSAWCTAVVARNWRKHLEHFLDPWPEELEMEITRNDYWGQI